MTRLQLAGRVLAAVTVMAVAGALRWSAVQQLPIDYDEDDYLRAGQQYATGLQTGAWAVFTEENYRPEHPPLQKILYGLAITGLPAVDEIPDAPTTAEPARRLPQPHLTYARAVGALFGALTAGLLALLNPVAGLFLAVHTWSIKYTSQVMLEAVPAFTSLAMVLAYQRSEGRRPAWLALSALAFGLTVAGKYPYGLAAVAVAAHWLWRARPAAADQKWTAHTLARWLGPVAAWAALAGLVFLAADPYLWPDPVGRLRSSLLYHGDYAQSAAVEEAGFPMWQPLVWLTMSVPWHPEVFTFSFDIPIALLALAGIRRAWTRQPLLTGWLGLVLAFLLVWNTKWPQYILMLTAPWCVLAAYGLHGLAWEPLQRWWAGRPTAAARRERPNWRELGRALPWLLPGLAAVGVITLFPLVFQMVVALTDYQSANIRDGINGGVWRAAWEGISGQAAPIPFSVPPKERVVSYTGPGVLLSLLSDGAGLLAFEALWTGLVVTAQTALGVLVALMLHRRGVRFKGAWQTLFILPVAIPEFVGALSWLNLTEPSNGWISLAIGAPLGWERSPEETLLILLSAAVWLGWPLLLLAATAGLNLIPAEVYDAAAIDGAGAWQQFWLITWPMLLPLLTPAIIIRAIFAFNQFYIFYTFAYFTQGNLQLMTLAALSYFVFNPNYGFGGQFSVSAGINLLIVAALVVFLLWFNRWTRATEGVTYA